MPVGDRGDQQLEELAGERARRHQPLGVGTLAGEPPDRERRVVHGEGRDHDVHPRAVIEARVGHRAELVDAPPQGREDPFDRVAKRRLRVEAHIGGLELTAPLHEDLIRPVHEHVLDLGVGQQGLQGPEPHAVAQQQLLDLGPSRALEERRLVGHELADGGGEATGWHPARRRGGSAALAQPVAQVASQALGVYLERVHPQRRLKRFGSRPLARVSPVAEIEVVETDITQLEVDAIANAANTDLRHGGGVAEAIVRAGGSSIQDESDELAPIDLGAAVPTGAGDLPCRWVIHAATMRLGGPTSAQIIREATASTLRAAAELGARSLALVAFGTGVGGFPVTEAARIEAEEVRRHLDAGGEPQRVVFAVRGAEAREAFEQAVATD